MKKRLKQSIAAVGVAALIALGGATAAHAGTTYVSFDVLMPKWQQGVTTASQTKSGSTSTLSTARIDGIGSTYKANLRTARTNGGTQYGAEKFGINEGVTVSLDSPFASGAGVGLNIHNSAWAPVDVQIFGAFKSN